MAKCFFCGEEILEKIHKEHIIPNAFLKELNLKNEKFTIHNGEAVDYGRLKVSTHQRCNNEYGSRYEQQILKILNNLDSHKNELANITKKEKEIICRPSGEIADLLTSWFIKIFYGIIWFEINYKNNKDTLRKQKINSLLKDNNLNSIQKGYRNGKGFNLPSSLYYLKLNDIIPFDFGFLIEDQVFWMKIREHFFMLAIGDGKLCYSYINDDLLSQMKKYFLECKDNPLCFFTPLSHLIAVQRNLPKKPSYVVAQDWIMNTSLMTGSTQPRRIDREVVNREAKRVRNQLLDRHFTK